MRTTIIARTARAHKPMIHFLGKRQWPSTPHEPAPHPAAPKGFQDTFQDFLKKFKASASGAPSKSTSSPSPTQSTSKKSSDAPVLEGSWELPKRYWSRTHTLGQAEIEAIESGGASLH